MSTFPWLTVAGAIPLAGALIVAAVPSGDGERSRDQLVKQLSLGFTLITLVVIEAMAVRFRPGVPTFQFTQVT